MVVKRIPAGTRFFLTKRLKSNLAIQPGKTIINDSLYVAYDIRVDGFTIIPKGTRIIGNWVTDKCPMAAQLQVTKVYLYGSGQELYADSDVYETCTEFNRREIDNSPYVLELNQYKSQSNLVRRVAKFQHRTKMLTDERLNSAYISINTKEIAMTLTQDFEYEIVDMCYESVKCERRK